MIRALDGWDAQGLKVLAAAIAEQPGHRAVLMSSSSPFLIAVARAADVRGDSSAVVKSLTARFGGRGGGRPEIAQAGGLSGSLDDIVGAARKALEP